MSGESKKQDYGGGENNQAILDESIAFFIKSQQLEQADSQGQKEKKGREIISMFIDHLQRNNGGFNHLMAEIKKDWERDERIFSADN